MSQHAKSTRDEWSQVPCLMTALPAAPAMARLAGVMPQDAPSEVAAIVATQAAVPTETCGEGPNAKVNVALRC